MNWRRLAAAAVLAMVLTGAGHTRADERRANRAAWAVVGKRRADEVRRWLAEFRRAAGWEPGMVWDPHTAGYRWPRPPEGGER